MLGDRLGVRLGDRLGLGSATGLGDCAEEGFMDPGWVVLGVLEPVADAELRLGCSLNSLPNFRSSSICERCCAEGAALLFASSVLDGLSRGLSFPAALRISFTSTGKRGAGPDAICFAKEMGIASM